MRAVRVTRLDGPEAVEVSDIDEPDRFREATGRGPDTADRHAARSAGMRAAPRSSPGPHAGAVQDRRPAGPSLAEWIGGLTCKCFWDTRIRSGV
jgi:hypothetical protein